MSELVTALPQAVAPLQELSKLQDPTTDLQSSPELEAAAAKAPNCQTLKKNSWRVLETPPVTSGGRLRLGPPR